MRKCGAAAGHYARLVQESFLFSLRLLARYGDTPRPEGFYADAFLRAFPMALEETEDSQFRTREDTARMCYGLRTFRFAELLGLAERVDDDERRLVRDHDALIRKRPLLDAWIRLETHYYFALLGILLPLVYLVFPRWLPLDALLAAAVVTCCAYFFGHAEDIVDLGWEFGAPPTATWLAAALWVLLLEAVRRAGGWALFGITLAFSLMPLVADRLPGPFAGLPAGETAWLLAALGGLLLVLAVWTGFTALS